MKKGFKKRKKSKIISLTFPKNTVTLTFKGKNTKKDYHYIFNTNSKKDQKELRYIFKQAKKWLEKQNPPQNLHHEDHSHQFKGDVFTLDKVTIKRKKPNNIIITLISKDNTKKVLVYNL